MKRSHPNQSTLDVAGVAGNPLTRPASRRAIVRLLGVGLVAGTIGGAARAAAATELPDADGGRSAAGVGADRHRRRDRDRDRDRDRRERRGRVAGAVVYRPFGLPVGAGLQVHYWVRERGSSGSTYGGYVLTEGAGTYSVRVTVGSRYRFQVFDGSAWGVDSGWRRIESRRQTIDLQM